MHVPSGWTAPGQSDAWLAWVDGLPRLTRALLDEWELAATGEQWHGRASLVLAVRTAEGDDAVLKLGGPHDGAEPEHLEHLALQHWHGRGAVALLRADPRRSALLLERLHATDLTDAWDLEACETVAGLYADLHAPAVPQLRRLSAYVERVADRLASLPRSAPVPHRMVEQAVSLGRAFATDEATDGRIVHGDLHYAQVLSADREPWLAVGPEPLNGDPHYEVAPLLWHRWPELAGDVRGGVRRRFHATIDAAGLDEDRARDWVVVRMLDQVLGELTQPTPDADRLTRFLTVAKAVQD